MEEGTLQATKGGSALDEKDRSDFRSLSDSSSKDAFEDEETQEDNEFKTLYEESLKGIKEGNVLRGLIVEVNKEIVLVDIGYKSEGEIPIREFIDEKGKVTAKEGDEIDVLLVRRENELGRIVLSKERAERARVWDHIKEAYEANGTVRGNIISTVKGGFSVETGGVMAFLPGSQVDIGPVGDWRALLGREYDFKVVKFNKRQENIVLSRRALLEEERLQLREKTLPLIKEGAVFNGTVKNIAEYGLFVDLGGIDGLVHTSDMSWGKTGKPSGLYKVGDEVKVKVLKFDPETERVSLGIKQLTPDPWNDIEDKYPAGTKVRGTVVKLTNYGAFFEIEEGIEGLIHISEMSWTKKVSHPSQLLKLFLIILSFLLLARFVQHSLLVIQ